MARTKIDPVQVGWSEILTGSLAGPASFLGLNASGEAVLVAASDYVAAGGGGATAADDIAEGDGIVNITTTTGSITLDTPGDIILSADGGNVKMDDGTTTVFDFDTDNVVFKMMDDADTGDYMSFTVGAAGSTVAATNDDDGYAANLTFDVDGIIYLDSYLYGTTVLREGAQEYLRFQRASSGTDHAEIQNMENGMDVVFKQYDGTETFRLADDGNATVAADLTVGGDIIIDDGGSIKEAGGTAAITIDGSGHVTKIGQDSPSSDEVLTWDGSKAVWSAAGGGSSKQTWSVPIAGRFRVLSATRLITHGSGLGNAQGGDWTLQRTECSDLSNTSFTSDGPQAFFYYTCAIAPFACTLQNISCAINIKNDAAYDYPNIPKFRVWKGVYTNDSSDDVTWYQIHSAQQFGTANVAVISRADITSFNTSSFAQGDLMALTFETGGSILGSGKENQFIFQFTALED